MSTAVVADSPKLETSAAAPAQPRRSPVGKLVFLLLLVGAGVWGVPHAIRMYTHVETDDAYLTGHIHQVSSHVSGTIVEVLAPENAEVAASAPLYRLDPRDHDAKLKSAEAQLAQSDAMIEYAKVQGLESKAKVDQAQAQLVKAEADWTRMQELTRSRVISAQEQDAARAAVDIARASLASAEATAKGMQSALQVAFAQRANSALAVDNAKLQLSYNTIVAPVAGFTSRRSTELGAYVQPGQTLIAIVKDGLWVEANFKETQLTHMRLGQEAEVTIDALPGHKFRGTVESFSPASGAQFALLPPDNATGNFTKVVQRVPVRVRLEPESTRGFEERLRAGLSVVVAVKVK